MPNRILRESILTSDRVNQLGSEAECFYRRLMNVVDDFGRFDARPSVVRAACFPILLEKVSDQDCVGWLLECQKVGLIILYEVSGKPFLEFRLLGDPRAKRSKYPEMPESARTRAHMQTFVPYSYSLSYSLSNSNAHGGEKPARMCAHMNAEVHASIIGDGLQNFSDRGFNTDPEFFLPPELVSELRKKFPNLDFADEANHASKIWFGSSPRHQAKIPLADFLRRNFADREIIGAQKPNTAWSKIANAVRAVENGIFHPQTP